MEKKITGGGRNPAELYLKPKRIHKSLFLFWLFAFLSFFDDCDSWSYQQGKSPYWDEGKKEGGAERVERTEGPSWFRNNNNKKSLKMN